MTIKQASRITGLAYATMHDVRSGKTKNPEKNTIEKIMKLHGMSGLSLYVRAVIVENEKPRKLSIRDTIFFLIDYARLHRHKKTLLALLTVGGDKLIQGQIKK